MIAEHALEEFLSSDSKHLYLFDMFTDWCSFLCTKKYIYNMNCNWRATGFRKNTERQHRDTFTYLKQQRMTFPSILSALQNEIHMIRHPCIQSDIHALCGMCSLHIFVSLICWAACSIKIKKKIQTINFLYAFDKGVTLSTLSTFAATSHQSEISSELTKVAEPGLIGREMANFQQLPGAAEFSSN